MICPSSKLCGSLNVIVSSLISIPPPRDNWRESNSISRNLLPMIGFNSQPSPFIPVSVTERTSSTSKSCGSTRTDFTIPWTTGST